MNAAKSTVKTLGLIAALAFTANLAIAGHDSAKSPFDGLGGIGGTNTARHDAPLLARGGDQSSPYDFLGGIGGRGTAHAPATLVSASDANPRSPFDSLGGIGGRGTARSIAPLLVMGHDDRSPFDSLGGIGGRNTARAPALAA
jgi:hypothetical protein